MNLIREISILTIAEARRAQRKTIMMLFILCVLCVSAVTAKEFEGRELVVSIRTTEAGEIEKAASAGADGVLLLLDDPSKAPTDEIQKLSEAAKKNGLKLWIGVVFSNKVPTPAPSDAKGLALIFAPPTGEPVKLEDIKALLNVKKKGDQVGESIRQIKKQLAPGKKLAVCVAESEISPETTRNMYVPVKDLVRDGTVDLVCLSGAERFNFHRLRLLRDAPLRVGIFLDGKSNEEKSRGGVLSRAALAVVENDTCECLWLSNFPVDLISRVIPDTIQGYKRNLTQRESIEKAVASGELVIDQEISEKRCNDQASVHGVGQSFVPSRDGLCPLVQIYAAMRGCEGALPPPLDLDIRMSDRNMPGGLIYAKTQIPAAEFGHEPTYRWGNAYFEPPVRLKKGERYWIYLPNAAHPEGTYIWRLVKDGASDRGNAWSSRYDYTKHSWVFRVYMKKK